MGNSKWFNRIFIGFGVLIASWSFFEAGLDAHKGFYNDSVGNVILAVFWIAILWIMIASVVRDRMFEVEEKEFKKTSKMLDELNRFMDKQLEEKHKEEMIEAIVKDVLGKSKPAAKFTAKIEKAIADNLNLFSKVTVNKQGGFDIVCQNTPFPENQNKAKVVRKAAQPTKTGAVKKGGKK